MTDLPDPEPMPDPDPVPDDAPPISISHTGSGDNLVANTINKYQAPSPPLPVPRQLPGDVAKFTARRDDLAALDAFLNDRRTQTNPMTTALIVGTAGVGKTALAIRWANRVAGDFPDGQLYVDMYSYSASGRRGAHEVLSDFLAALNVPSEKIPVGLDERAALFRTQTAGRRLLVLIDNVDRADQVRPLLPGAGESVVLVTSRNQLGGLAATVGVHNVPLAPLRPEESTELIGAVVDAARVAEDENAVGEIARLCGHLPLALRIAAVRIALDSFTPLAMLASDLADQHKRLEELRVDDLAVRTAFSWSYQLLPPHLAHTFRMLGLHPGPEVGTHVVVALTDQRDGQATTDLVNLVNANLLNRIGRDRFAFHDLLKDYSVELTEKLDSEADRAGALTRTLDFYLHSAAAAEHRFSPQRRRVPLDTPAAGSDPLTFDTRDEAMRWCETERTNVAAATRAAAAAELLDVAWKLPACMALFYYIRKHWTDWLDLNEIALDAATRVGDPLARAWVLNSLGNAHYDLERFDEAVEHHLEAHQIRHDNGDSHGAAISLMNLGESYRGRREFDEAVDCFRRAEERFASLRPDADDYGRGMAINNLGNALREAGRFTEALPVTLEALELRRTADDPHGEAFTLNNLGDVYRELGMLDEAEAVLRQALEMRKRLRDDHNAAVTLFSLGCVARDRGMLPHAAALMEEAARILDPIDPDRAAVVRARIADLGLPPSGPDPS